MRGPGLTVVVCYALAALPAAAAPPSEAEMAARIDALLAEAWAREGVEPAPPAGDAEFLRRAWLDLCGIVPPVNDPDGISGVRDFLAASDPGKRRILIERLVARPAHATHFANVWRGVLLRPQAGVQQAAGVAAFQTWLRGQLADNVPYDKLIEDLILTRGTSGPGPALFFTSLAIKPDELAASTSRAFLGVQIECAQCHDHPFDKWKQRDFWGLAAFFGRLQGVQQRPQAAASLREAEAGEVRLPGTDEIVPPKFLGGEVSPDELAATRRQRLVQWLTWPENPFVARAAVNRVWAQLFGRGLVEPVDDMGAHNPPSHPELLVELAAYFVRTGYDLNALVRTLATTRAYQLSSQSLEGDADRPELFARMAIKSLTAEQLYDCLLEATRRREVPLTAQQIPFRRIDQERSAFLARFQSPGQRLSEYQGGIPQALVLLNGATIRQATDLGQSDLLAALDAPFLTSERRVEALFLSTLSRPPDEAELARFTSHVQKASSDEDRRRALGDALWAILNSAEFGMNH